MRIEYHRTLIADKVRNDAFFRALKSVIVPGKTIVADIGAGTGLLGMMAAKLGARDVYLYEAAEISGVAGEHVKQNRLRNCHVMPCHSTEMVDPPQVDVIISETLGNYALEENIVDTLNDARQRFLSDGGLIIPASARQYVSPVIAPRLYRELRVWSRVGHGLDLSFAQSMSLNNVYVRTLKPDELLVPNGDIWDEVDFSRKARSTRKGEAKWLVGRDVCVFGLAVWWTIALTDQISLSTAPGAPRTHWEQLYFPFLSPIELKKGEVLSVSLRSRSSEAEGTHLSWSVARFDTKGSPVERQAMDLDKGYLP